MNAVEAALKVAAARLGVAELRHFTRPFLPLLGRRGWCARLESTQFLNFPATLLQTQY